MYLYSCISIHMKLVAQTHSVFLLQLVCDQIAIVPGDRLLSKGNFWISTPQRCSADFILSLSTVWEMFGLYFWARFSSSFDIIISEMIMSIFSYLSCRLSAGHTEWTRTHKYYKSDAKTTSMRRQRDATETSMCPASYLDASSSLSTIL